MGVFAPAARDSTSITATSARVVGTGHPRSAGRAGCFEEGTMKRGIDRSACRETTCTCHDDATWTPGAYPHGCSACGCQWGAPIPEAAERYAGERHNLIGVLRVMRPGLVAALEASDPLILLVDAALRSGDLNRLRVAVAAVSMWKVEADALRGPAGGSWVH
jgi:hypothetical protein